MAITLTFLGHAGFLLDDGSHCVAIDPFLTGNPVATKKPKDIRCKAVVLTHGHGDHFGDCVAIAKDNDATIYAPNEIAQYVSAKGCKAEPGNPGGKISGDFGWVAFTPAFHSSSYDDKYMGMPCGAVVHIGGVTVYHCGDTGLFGDMKLIGEEKIDLALLPIGDNYTMGPDDALRAVKLLKPKVVIPIHYNTWELLAQDVNAWARRVKALTQGKTKVAVLKPGETYTL